MKRNMISSTPTLFWITGLSGSGKTTIGMKLAKQLKDRGLPVIFLDGDILREVFNNQFNHDRDSRKTASMQYAKLCRMLVNQHINVVCSTISLFHDTHEWNRKHIPNYLEIFIDVPLHELAKRDIKNIYSRAQSGELKNIVGIDIKPEFPKQADLVIQNHADSSPEDNVNLILKKYDAFIHA